jgi:hypothetical protein
MNLNFDFLKMRYYLNSEATSMTWHVFRRGIWGEKGGLPLSLSRDNTWSRSFGHYNYWSAVSTTHMYTLQNKYTDCFHWIDLYEYLTVLVTTNSRYTHTHTAIYSPCMMEIGSFTGRLGEEPTMQINTLSCSGATILTDLYINSCLLTVPVMTNKNDRTRVAPQKYACTATCGAGCVL